MDIIRVDLISANDFYILQETLVGIGNELASTIALPSGHLFDSGWVQQQCTVTDGKVYPNGHIWWDGVNSDVDPLLDILKQFSGSADIIVVFMDGTRGGYRVGSDVREQRVLSYELGSVVS